MGSHVVERALREGHEVRCLVRSPARAMALEGSGCRTVIGDVGSARALGELCAGVDAVVHVAGLVAALSEEEFLRVNRDGTAAVAAAARSAGARLVYVSSLAVTGPSLPGRPRDESGPPEPVTAYGRSKAAGEAAVRASGAAFTIVRPPVVYGPRDREIFRLFRSARLGVVPIVGDGRQELSLVEAGDLAAAVLAVLGAEATIGRTYHAAHPRPLTGRELSLAIGEAVGRRPVVIPVPPLAVRGVLAVSGLVARATGRATVLDPAKLPEIVATGWACTADAIARDAGWRATVDHAEGLRRAAEWYRKEGWL